MGDYVLQTNKTGQRALEIQQAALEGNSLKLLEKAGLKPGYRVWDIGCGNGEMTEILAKQVGPSGKVFALDARTQQLEAVRKRIFEAGLNNVDFIHSDLDALEILAPESADLVFSRLIFMHLKSPDRVFGQILKLLRPGGILTIQEPTWSRFKTVPKIPLLEEYMQKLKKSMDYYGVDYEFGDKVLEFGKKHALNQLYYEEEETVYSGPIFRELISIRLEELKGKFLESKAATQEDLDRWRAIPGEIEKAGDDFVCHNGSIHQVVFEKEEGVI
ncbi:MAG: class I SAM-dependent methyltransferase [bacterium]|nr:class I SAM-dependent methyltransferase [bacterium]